MPAGGTELSPERYRDRELGDEYLTLYARRDEYPDDFMSRIEGIDTGDGRLLVTTDFRPPRRRKGDGVRAG